MRNYILTGTPGSGKTSLINALKSNGYEIIAEAATDIIAQEQTQGTTEPWKDSSFIDKILFLQQSRFQETTGQVTFRFFDRSPVCAYALAIYLGHEPSALLLNEITSMQEKKLYESNVFFIENLGFIENTHARQINFADALKFEKIHMDTYRKFGYNLIKIQKATIAERLQKIIGNLKS